MEVGERLMDMNGGERSKLEVGIKWLKLGVGSRQLKLVE